MRMHFPSTTGRRPWAFRPRRLAVVLTALTLITIMAPRAAEAGAAAAPAEVAAPAAPPGGRVVRHFDFEELELVPVRLPRPWQNLADELGLPRFGDWAVRNDQSATGNWSLRLDPDGVPMAFGIPSGVLLVHPMTDYRVRCRVRTEGLGSSRVQLVSMLCDQEGRTIDASVSRSPAVRSPDQWSTIEVTTAGVHPEAVSLRVELHLLQPRRPDAETNPVAAARPALVDVRGSAWFDDVVVEHRSRVEMTMSGTAGVVVAPVEPTLSVAVHDLTTAGLVGELRVRDADGVVVHVDRYEQLRSGAVVHQRLPLQHFGWYRAELTVRTRHGIVGEHSIPFAWVPAAGRSGIRGPGRLGVTVDATALAPEGDLAGLITTTGVRMATFPVWPLDDPGVAGIAPTIDRLLDRGLEIIAELSAIRREQAGAAGLDQHQVAAFLAAAPEGWRTDLEPLVVAFGLRINRWIIGPRSAAASALTPVDPADVGPAARRLATALPAPIAVFTENAPRAGRSDGAAETLLRIPMAASPESIPSWMAGGSRTIELELDQYRDVRDAEIDLALRVLHAWRAGAESVLVALPWIPVGPTGQSVAPDRTLPVLRVLADALQGRRVVGELRLSDGVSAWLLGGESREDGALVLWREGRAGDASTDVPVRLGSGPVSWIGPRGDRRRPSIDGTGRHIIPVGPRPVFVEGIDLALLRFRAALAIVPDEVPAVYRAHELELVISNPWDIAIAGLIALEDDPTRSIRPLRVPFTLQPGQTLRRPLTVVFDRAVAAGVQMIPTMVTVESVEAERFQMDLPVTVGWKDIDLSATWRIEIDPETGRRDLVIRQYVTNRGKETVQLDAFLRGPGLGRQRRPLEQLAPGATAARTFRVPDGVQRLSGTVLRYGVSERGGAAQLNRPLAIPQLVPVGVTASVPTP